MTVQLVTYTVDGRVGIVSLNRPDKLNAISGDLKRALVERFHEADRDAATSVVVLRAEGRSFSAGYDIGPSPARKRARLARVAHRRRRARDDALGHEEARDRVRPGPLSRRGLRAGDAVRPHDRR